MINNIVKRNAIIWVQEYQHFTKKLELAVLLKSFIQIDREITIIISC